MFPGAHSTVYRNEAGEPLGWDDEPESLDAYDYERQYGARDAAAEDDYELGQAQADDEYEHGTDIDVPDYGSKAFRQGYQDRWNDLNLAEEA